MVVERRCHDLLAADHQLSGSHDAAFLSSVLSQTSEQDTLFVINDAQMEVVAAAASITALIQISATCVRCATEITQRFRDAPDAIQHVSRQLKLLHNELIFVDGLKDTASNDDLALLPEETQTLLETLETANSLIHDVLSACNKYSGRSKARNRMAWVFFDDTKMVSMMNRLQDVRTSLQTILQSVNM